jgi:RimJ/RimL family protein N-acetyltransferase
MLGATNTPMITEEEFIDFACPYCRDPISFPFQQRDSLQQCPMCMASIVVPGNPGEPAKPIPVPFSTERLTLRRLASGDWKDLLEILSDEETFRYTAGHPLDEEAILKWLESDPHVRLTTPDQMFWLAMTLSNEGKLIGNLGMRLSAPDMRQAHVTIQMNRAYQRQRFATEALTSILTFCFDHLRLHRVSASCDSRNAAAVKLLEKAGLRREGEFVQDSQIHGEWRNTVWYALLREEFCGKSA